MNDFTQGSILKKMIMFMIPILGALVLQAMYGAVDLMIVGQFGTTSGLSGISTGSNIMNLATFVVAGLAMAVTVQISKYIGMKNEERIARLLGATIALFSVISVVVSVVLIIFAPQLSVLMQAPEEALDLTVQYVRICGAGFLLITAYNTISSVFRGLGDSKSPLIFVAIACCVNIVGDLVLVAGFHLNVIGAAVATVAAQGISVLLSVLIIRKKKLPFHIHKQDICFNEEIKGIFKIGTPIALQELLTQLSFLALCAFVNSLGLAASSGYGVASKIQGFVMLIPGSLMQSMSSFVSQNVGAGKEKRAFRAMLTGIGIGAAGDVLHRGDCGIPEGGQHSAGARRACAVLPAAHAFHHHAAGRRRNMVNQPKERRRMGGRDRFVGSVHTAAGRNRRGRRSAAHLVEFQELRRQHRT